ncbi:elicitor-responsive protein 3 [Amborella trichopoda]|uniref:C2 domain-containing protein n=1 Tax=Amborella trichopoda TaxID=13333 RepID=W1NVN7_AMBTC|nr:elicitor-responsive protein 3 [Amborella trichopoda]ERM99403.1 hypothetical protein AMTR_s00131p00040320 [Amborella trichopoda]|eukprot:XP_006836550.1 elicitor-responsive protein 3 [Amborella trichopoda]
MSIPTGIQGHLLEVTVVGCAKLKDTEWISRQDPYVCLEYANTKFRTKTCTDGGKNPTFQEKFVFSLIEGLREINITVWNSNTLTFDDFIGSGRVQIQKVLTQGFDDNPWTLQSKSGKYAGEVKLVLHYPKANKSGHGLAPSAPMYPSHGAQPPYVSTYPHPYPTPSTYPPVSTSPSGYAPPLTSASAYPPQYPPAAAYPPQYPPAPAAAAYPPQYPPAPGAAAAAYPYPASPYPQSTYPPPPYPPPHGGAFYPGTYPPY